MIRNRAFGPGFSRSQRAANLGRLIAPYSRMPGGQHRDNQHEAALEDQRLRSVVDGQDPAGDNQRG